MKLAIVFLLVIGTGMLSAGLRVGIYYMVLNWLGRRRCNRRQGAGGRFR